MASELCPCDGRTIFHELRVGKSTLNDFYMEICLIQSFFWEVNNSVKNIISFTHIHVYTHTTTHTHTRVCAESLQSCLRSPMDHSLPGSSVHGILQARIREWVAMFSSQIYIYTHTHIWNMCRVLLVTCGTCLTLIVLLLIHLYIIRI